MFCTCFDGFWKFSEFSDHFRGFWSLPKTKKMSQGGGQYLVPPLGHFSDFFLIFFFRSLIGCRLTPHRTIWYLSLVLKDSRWFQIFYLISPDFTAFCFFAKCPRGGQLVFVLVHFLLILEGDFHDFGNEFFPQAPLTNSQHHIIPSQGVLYKFWGILSNVGAFMTDFLDFQTLEKQEFHLSPPLGHCPHPLRHFWDFSDFWR